jgi:putative addiction module component (TIGR02574 family)
MRPEEIREEISRLELSEKLLLVEDIWDSIAENNADIHLSEWQKAELKKRYGEFKDGKLEIHDWESVHEELRKEHT